MTLNVFTKPRDAFSSALENPKIGASFLLAIITGIILGLASFISVPNPIVIGYGILFTLLQWIVYCALFWIFYVMFKEKKIKKYNFFQIATAVGKLWIIFLLSATLTLGITYFVSLGSLSVAIALFFILIIAGILFLIHSFVLIKTLTETGNLKSAAAWILLMIINVLLFTIVSLLTKL